MTRDNEPQRSETTDDADAWSRRTLLKLTGGGAGIAALGGVSVLGAGQEGDGTDTGENGTQTDGDADDDSVLLDDLIDPTFGYPLAADETGSVSISTVVEADQLEGGEHDGFPQQPGAGGGEFPIEFIFDPVGVQVAPDEVVHFLSVFGEHTITAFDEKYANSQLAIPTRVPEESPGFTSPPIVGGESWLYQFPESGVYDLLCLPHYGFGMVMRVVVFDPEDDDLGDEQFAVTPPEGVPPNVGAVLEAPELTPENVVEQESVAWADLTLDGGTDETPTEDGGTNGTATPGTDGNETATPGTDGNETGS